MITAGNHGGDRFCDALDLYVDAAPLTELTVLADLLPDSSIGLAGVAARIAGRITQLYRQEISDDPADIAKLADSLHTLATRLGSIRQLNAGLEAAREAVQLYGVLVRHNRAGHLADLARALRTLAERLRAAEQRAEGLLAVQESVDLARELAAGDRTQFLPVLARSLRALADSLDAVGRLADAVTAAQE